VESGQRQMAFCHECRDEWYTSDHGLVCPDCGSHFAEIVSFYLSCFVLQCYRPRLGSGTPQCLSSLTTDIFLLQIEENGNDPPEAATLEPPPFLHHHHDHYHDHDNDLYSHFESMRTERDGRGSLDYSTGLLSDSHFVRARYYFGPGDRRTSASPYLRQQERPMSGAERPPEPVQMLDNLMARGFARESLRRTPLSRNLDGDEAADRSRNDDRDSGGPSEQGRNRPHTETIEFTMALGGGGEPPRFGRGRFVHNPNAGLGPRDANHAQPRLEPVDALSTYLPPTLIFPPCVALTTD
jgi:hypothetical protein